MTVFNNNIPITYNLELQHKYMLRSVTQLDNGFDVHYFTKSESFTERDGILLQVNNGSMKNWIGVFAFGISSFSGVYSMPRKDSFCVVAKGVGYIVSADDPETWEIVPATPITDAKISIDSNVIVFSNFTELVAYGEKGFLWRSGRLAFDGLKLTAFEGHYILGEYFDIRSERIETFKVNLYKIGRAHV